MFWGLIMEPNKRYTQIVEKAFHLSMASLDASTAQSTNVVQVMICYDNRNYLLCTLQKGSVWQVPLDLNFAEGTKIAFTCNGDGHVHLTGYLAPEEEEGLGDYDDFDEEEEEEEEEEIPELVGQKKRKAATSPVEQNKRTKKSKVAEDDDEDDDDDDESDSDAPNGMVEDDSDDEDADDDEEDDDDDDEEDDDEDDEEEDDEEDEKEEIVEVPAKLSKNQKKKLKQQQKQQQNQQNQQQNQKEKTKLVNGKAEAKSEQQQGKQKKSKEDGKTEEKSEQQQQQKKRTVEGGVQVEDLKVGSGAVAKPGKFVTVYYVGRLKNGKKFDATNSGNGFKFRLGKGEVIKGWDTGVAGMKVGGKRRLVIPPAMAYGSKGSPPVIPPNSILNFEVELKAVH